MRWLRIIQVLGILGLSTGSLARAASPEREAQLDALLKAVQRGTAKGAKAGVGPKDKTPLLKMAKREQKKLAGMAQKRGGQYIGKAGEGEDEAIDPWSAAYEATRPSNPLVSAQCRQESFAEAAEHHQKETGNSAEGHFKGAAAAFGKGALKASDYFDHLTECRHFCARVVGLLLSCHVDAIASLPAKDTVLVLFGTGKDDVGRRSKRKLRAFAERFKKSDKRILMYGSASRLNARDGRGSNEGLSRRRAEAVRRALLSAGVPDEKIFLTWINQDPPRLSDPVIAERLGFLGRWRALKRRGRRKFMDQNVLVVAWEPS